MKININFGVVWKMGLNTPKIINLDFQPRAPHFTNIKNELFFDPSRI